MNPLLFLILPGSLLLLLLPKTALASSSSSSSLGSSSENTDDGSAPGGGVEDNVMGLPDVEPSYQGGKWKRDYDAVFYKVGQRYKLPFALLKAHAIRESALKPSAYRLEPSGKASYGLMQILWWKNSNRFADYGYDDDKIRDGSILYDTETNIEIAAQIILDNWDSYGNIRDCVNSYNTGVRESKRVAPNHYVDDVLSYYSKMTGRKIS